MGRKYPSVMCQHVEKHPIDMDLISEIDEW